MEFSSSAADALPTPRPFERVRLSFRTRRMLALGVVLVAIAIAVPRFLTHTPYQRLGVRLDWNTPGHFAKVQDVVGPPGKGLLQKGDLLLEYDGHALTRENMMVQMKQAGWPRGPMELEIERRGERLRFVIPPLSLSAWQRVRAVALPLIAVVAAPLVAILLVWRRPDLNAAWVFLGFAVLQALGAIWNLFRYPQIEVSGSLKGYMAFYHVLIFWFPAVFLHFMTVFPRPRWGDGPRMKSAWFWVVVAAYAAPPLLFLLGRVFHRSPDQLYLVFQTIALPLGSFSLIERYARPPRPDWQPKAHERVLARVVAVTLLLAAALDAIPESPQVVALFTIPLMWLLYTVLIFAWLGSPLLIAYLIANDPAFDPRRLIVRSLPYALLSGVLTAIYLAIVVVAQRLFAAATGEQAMVFNVIAAICVAFAFAPLRESVQRTLDRLFGRDPRSLRRALDEGGRELLGALDRREVQGAVEAAIARGLKRRVTIEWPEHGMPQPVDRELREEERSGIESLLIQAGIRLENLSLQEQRAAAERHAVELREAATRAELRALQAQVQPHFLFNALNALSYLTETDPKAAQRFTERLADMLRYTVEANERPAALLSEEIGFVEDYLGVARERYENPLVFEYAGSCELLSAAVPPLLLQPLVENSLKHGCTPGKDALHLALAARQDDGWLTLTFTDDGTSGNGSPGMGVGLQNLEQRVHLFAGGDSTMKAGVRTSGGFEVELRWRVNGRKA